MYGGIHGGKLRTPYELEQRIQPARTCSYCSDRSPCPGQMLTAFPGGRVRFPQLLPGHAVLLLLLRAAVVLLAGAVRVRAAVRGAVPAAGAA